MDSLKDIFEQLETPKKEYKLKNQRRKGEFTLKVSSSPNLQRYKDNIITALYNSNEVQKIVKNMCFSNNIHKDTKVWEDVVQETFMWLSKKEPAEIIEMYEDNPARLIALSVTIARFKGFASNSKDKDYNKHSLAKYIMFTSNLQQLESISPTDDIDEDDSFTMALADSDTLGITDNFKEMWNIIMKELTEDEKEFLDYYINMKKKRGKQSQAFKDRYNSLIASITFILEQNGFKTR